MRRTRRTRILQRQSAPLSMVVGTWRRGRVAFALVSAGSLLTGTILALSPAASAASSAYAVTEVPVGSGDSLATDPVTNTIYAGSDGGLNVIDGASGSQTTQVATGWVVGAVAVDTSSDTVYAFSAPYLDTAYVIDGATNTVTDTIGMPIPATEAAADPDTDTIYAMNEGEQTIAVVDGATNAVGSFQLSDTSPRGIAVDAATDTIYVADAENDQVVVVNGATNTVADRIALPAGSDPAGVAVDSADGLVYVADEGTGAISVIDASTDTASTLVSGMAEPYGLAFDAGSDTLYATSSSGSADGLGTTYAIDAASGGITDQIPRGGTYIAVAPGSGASASAYIDLSPGALNGDVTIMTPSTTTTMSPVIVNGLPAYSTFTVGQSVQEQLTADATPAATFSATGLPPGITLSPSGLLSGTPAAGSACEYNPVVTAANGIAPPATASTNLTVEQAPAITSTDQATFPVAVGGRFTVTTLGCPVISESGALPAGVTFTAGLGLLSGTPAAGTTGVYPIQFTATNELGTVTQDFTLAVPAPLYTPVGPVRVLDTRNGTGAPQAPVGPGGTISLQVEGVDGVPTSGVTAVVLNVTATDPTASSYVTVYPDGETRPTASNLNFTAGETIPNLVTVPVGADGEVDFYNFAGSVNLVADLAGYYTDSTTGSSFVPTGPSRVLDTRNGTGGYDAPVGPGGTLSLQVDGTDGVPATGVSAVVLNVTATDPTASSYVTVYPDGETRPVASNLNFTAGETIPNLVIVPVGADGRIDFYNFAGSTDLVADLAGYYTSSSDTGSAFEALGPVRVLDTRNGTGYSGPVDPGETISLQITSNNGVPASGVTAVVLNVTATEPTASSYVTVYPDGDSLPIASNLNFTAGETIPNLVVVPVGADGKIDFYNNSGLVELVADLAGYFIGP
jgi:YVTN family beta-propeller protein